MLREGPGFSLVRIGIDAHYLGNQKTGNETYTLNLMRSLARIDSGRNSYSIYVTNPAVAAQQVVADPRFQNRLLEPATAIFRLAMVFPCELALHPVDLLHAQYFVPPFVSCKTVVTIHDISFADRSGDFQPVHRWGLKCLVPWSVRRAERVLVVSQWLKEAVVRLYDVEPRKVVVTPLGVSEHFYPRDIESARAHIAANFGIEEPFILYVGNIVPGKNVSGILQAFSKLRQNWTSHPKKLVIIGPKLWGWSAANSLATDLKLQDRVVWLGYVPHEILPLFYSACEAFLFPSFSETFGLPVLEAMSCGAPVIASTRGALPEVTAGAAVLVNPEAPDDIAEGLFQVLCDQQLASDLRRKGIERGQMFTWDATAAKTLAVYNELI